MYSLLLPIIYLSFVSLGLPDSLLGAAWPIMRLDLGAPIASAGSISMIIAGGTIASSLLTGKLISRLGTGLLTVLSVMLTAVALLGFSLSDSLFQLCLWAIPYGVGAGAVDAALNNYVALHYSSRHMNWLHCSWGIGASIGPYIMGLCLAGGQGWHGGYRSVFYFQLVLMLVLWVSLPLWQRNNKSDVSYGASAKSGQSLWGVLKIRGVKMALVTFFAYCAIESTAGLWAGSYLAQYRGFDASIAARFASLFYLGITVGRALSGFVSERVGDRLMIRAGIITIIVGLLLFILPLHWDALSLIGLIVAGFGCAPIYPSIIHATPSNFGASNSQSVIGLQMASAYFGTTFVPPLFGLVAEYISISLYPLFLLGLAVAMLYASELLGKVVSRTSAPE